MNEAETGPGWQDYTELKGMLRALGDIARLNLVRVLARSGEVNVTDLALALRISQPLVSWHLSALRRHGLVQTRRQGRQVYCSLHLERYRACLRMLGAVIGDAPDAHEAHEPPAPASPAQAPPHSADGTGNETAEARPPHASSAPARSPRSHAPAPK